MDKYVKKSDISKFGIESIDTEKLLRDRLPDLSINKNFSIELLNFKKKLNNRLNKFDPTKLTSSKTDEILKLLWFSYLFNNITPEKQKEMYIQYGFE